MRKTLFTGLIILLPIVVTIMIFTFLIDFFTEPFLYSIKDFIEPIRDRFPAFPEKGVIIIARITILLGLLFFIVLLGMVARWFFFRSLLNVTHKILSKIPFVKSIYTVTKEIAGAFFKEEGRTAFKYAAMVAFPSEASESVGFVTGQPLPEIKKWIDEPLLPVFVPTAPHPISGYMILVPENKIKKINMTIEEAVKLTVSCGVIVPGENP